jgi:hypothetical protein
VLFSPAVLKTYGLQWSELKVQEAPIEIRQSGDIVEANPTVYGPREFREKLAAKNHFLAAVAKDKEAVRDWRRA